MSEGTGFCHWARLLSLHISNPGGTEASDQGLPGSITVTAPNGRGGRLPVGSGLARKQGSEPLCPVMEVPGERLRAAGQQSPERSWHGLISMERRGLPMLEPGRTFTGQMAPGPTPVDGAAPQLLPRSFMPESQASLPTLPTPSWRGQLGRAGPTVCPTSPGHHIH